MKVIKGDTRSVANSLHRLITKHREDVSGRHTASPHLYHSDIDAKGSGEYQVRFWSEGGVFHDCRITAHVEDAGHGQVKVSWTHCGDDMGKLSRIIEDELD